MRIVDLVSTGRFSEEEEEVVEEEEKSLQKVSCYSALAFTATILTSPLLINARKAAWVAYKKRLSASFVCLQRV